MQRARRKREAAAGSLDDVHEFQVDRRAPYREFLEVRGEQPALDLDIERAVAKADEADGHLVGPDFFVGSQSTFELSDDAAHLGGARLVDEAEDREQAQAIARGVGLDALFGELAVGNGDDGAVECSDRRAAQSDVLDAAQEVAEFDGVALAKRLVDAHQKRTQQVLETFLGSERHGPRGVVRLAI